MRELTRVGVWTEWDANGRKTAEGRYVRGQRHGRWRQWGPQPARLGAWGRRQKPGELADLLELMAAAVRIDGRGCNTDAQRAAVAAVQSRAKACLAGPGFAAVRWGSGRPPSLAVATVSKEARRCIDAVLAMDAAPFAVGCTAEALILPEDKP